MDNINSRTEYIIPLLDVSNHVDEGNCSDSDCDASASSYHSYGSHEHDDEEEPSSVCSESVASSTSSASISIASNSESARYEDEEEDETEEDESEEGSAFTGDDEDDATESSEGDDDTEDDYDDEQDWGYKFFPDHDTRIRFSAEVEVHDTLTRNDYTPAEKMASFLTPKDKKAQWFYQNKAIAKLEWWLEETPEARVLYKQEKDEQGDDKFIPRGLHQMTDKGYDRMNYFKNACVDAVLQEQEAQWAAAGRPTTGVLWDFERMAAVSLPISRGGIMESIKIAKRDEQQAQKAYRQMERQQARGNMKRKQSKRSLTPFAVIHNHSNTVPAAMNNHNATTTKTTINTSKIITSNKGRPLSPQNTPTTVTTILTAAETTESSLLVPKSNHSTTITTPLEEQPQQEHPTRPQQQKEQPLDYLEVVSVDSTPSILTYLDDRSIVTPPATEEEKDNDQYQLSSKRLSLQEQQHPMCVLHESHHSFLDLSLNSTNYKRRASAPPIRNQSTMSELSRGD